MQNSRTWADRWFTPLLLLITLGSLLVRVVPLYDRVITPETVRFQSIDPYYHVRLSKYVTEHYPHRLEYDSLRLHPSGQRVDVYPAYDFVNATLALIVGAGSPSERTTEEAIAWSPPLLGSTTTALVGLAARAFAGPWGALAAALVAGFLPGGTLVQTMIGLSDHHALETFFLAAAWWLLTILVGPDVTRRKRLVSASLLGVVAGGYALTWEGSPVMPSVIGLLTVIRVLRQATDSPAMRSLVVETTVTTCVAVTLAWSAGFWSPMITVSSTLLLLSALSPMAMILLQRTIRTGSADVLRIAWVVVVLVVCAAVVAVVPSDLLSSLVTNLGRFDPSDKARTVSELRPMFEDPIIMWNNYGAAIAWGVAGLLLSLIILFRKGEHRLLVPILTGSIFIPAALLQLRFASSASLPLAMLNGVMVAELLRLWNAAGHRSVRVRRLAGGALVGIWLVTVGAWTVASAPRVAATDRGPSKDWTDVTKWLREHSPEFDTISKTEDTTIVRRTAVLNWWDAGYYITTMADRVPVSNPSQAGARLAADAYLDTTGERGVAKLALEAIRYVMVDATHSLQSTSQTAIAGLFPALAIWAGVPLEQYVRVVYFPREGGGLEPRYAYLPSYYKSLLIRLMLADGEALNPAPRATWAIQVETQVDRAGRTLDVIRSSRSFGTVAALEAFQRYDADSTWLIVGFSPFEPCVPLEPVRIVRLVHSSPTVALAHPTLRKPIPEIKVYSIEER